MTLSLVTPALLGGCKTTGDAAVSGDASFARDVPEPGAHPLDIASPPPPVEPFQRGLYYFDRGDFGLAEQAFRETVEKTPNNTGAWIGLAASYDNIRRFAFADRAYAMAISLAGETPQILNNQALSFMARGDLKTARARLITALRRDPANLTARNNLRLVEARIQARRHPE